MRRGITALAVLIGLICATISAHAQERLPRVAPGQGVLDLGPHVEVLEDPGGELDVQDVAAAQAAARFEPVGASRPNLGYSSSAFWLRARFELPADGEWLIEIGFAQLDDVRLYFRGRDGTWLSYQLGDRLAFEQRPVRGRTFIVGVPETAARPVELLVRVESSGSLLVPIAAWQRDAFVEHVSDEQLLLGIYYGFLLAMALYNLFLYFAVRDRGYLFYVLYLVTFALFQASMSGHAFMYLWPGAPSWAQVATVTFLCTSIAFGFLFVRDILVIRELFPRLYRPILYVAGLYLALVPLSWVAYEVGLRIAVVSAGLSIIALAAIIAAALRRGSSTARYVAMAFAAIVPGGVLLVLRQADVVPSSFLIEHLVKAGTALEAVLLSFALADRIHRLRREGAEAREKLVESGRNALAQQRRFAQRLLDAQDRERARIASELHDGVGQNLVVLVNRLRRAAKQEGRSGAIEPAAELATEAVRELRAVAHELHPHRLDRLGLADAVASTAEQMLDAAGIAHEVTVGDVTGVLPVERELHVYRIVQEALANVVKHSEAREASVLLRRAGEALLLEVEDDGRGIAAGAAEGVGLSSIRERVRLLAATLAVCPGAGGRGVCVRVEVPCDGNGSDRG